MNPPARLLVVADAAYKAKPDAQECLALRGYIIMLVGANKTDSKFPGGVCNALDSVSKKFHQVARISFAAELRHQVEAAHIGVCARPFIEEKLCPLMAEMLLMESMRMESSI